MVRLDTLLILDILSLPGAKPWSSSWLRCRNAVSNLHYRYFRASNQQIPCLLDRESKDTGTYIRSRNAPVWDPIMSFLAPLLGSEPANIEDLGSHARKEILAKLTELMHAFSDNRLFKLGFRQKHGGTCYSLAICKGSRSILCLIDHPRPNRRSVFKGGTPLVCALAAAGDIVPFQPLPSWDP